MESQRASQADSLTLTSAELVRIAVEVRRVEADEVKELGDPIAPRPAVTQAVDDERLLDDLSRAHARVERRVRILKDDLHIAPRLAQAPARKGEHVLAPDPYFARRGVDEPEHAAPGRRLSAARFADEPEGFPFLNREAHVVDRLDDRALPEQAGVAHEVFDEMGNFNERHQREPAS